MTKAEGMRTVMVLTTRPGDVLPALAAPGLEPVHAPGAAELLAALPGRLVSGFVLDVALVRRAAAPERELLYHLAQVFPLLRLRRRGQDVVFLDDPAAFRAAVSGFSPRAARHEPRAAVLLHGLLAPAENSAAAPLPAQILDLSSGGGLISAARPFEAELALRILELADQRPLTARVLWRRGPGRGARHGAGVRFVDIRSGQARELRERFLLRLAGGEG
jgi:hypothetical protein